MNQGFRGRLDTTFNQFTADFPRGDTNIQFCIDGVTNSDDRAAYADRTRAVSQMKGALDVGGMETLNIYVTSAGGYLGYAYFATPNDKNNDGVVLLNDSMPNGRPGWAYSQGDTLTHEVGHWLNLEHTHAGGCSGPGDYQDDVELGTTANEAQATYGCPVGLNNCNENNPFGPANPVNPIHSFMSYVDDSCMTEFTQGQAERMQATFEIYRYSATKSLGYSLDADGFPSMSSSSTSRNSWIEKHSEPLSLETIHQYGFVFMMMLDYHDDMVINNLGGEQFGSGIGPKGRDV